MAPSYMLSLAHSDTPSVAAYLEPSSSTSLEEPEAPITVISKEPSDLLLDVPSGKHSIFLSYFIEFSIIDVVKRTHYSS